MFRVNRWWERYGLKVILTIFVLSIGWVLRQTQGSIISEIYYFIFSSPNSQPRQESLELLTNARILELEIQLAELKSQNQKLQELVGYVESLDETTIAAPIIGRSPDSWWQQVTIGAGSSDGIKEGYVATGIGGLVGRIVNVTPNTSRVLLISDANSRIGSTISRSNYLGFIQGEGTKMAVMRFFEKVSDVKPGDTVTTSSVSRLFPAGLPIGKIKSIDLNKSPAPEAIVELTAPLNNLEWVVIHPFEPQF